MDEVLLATKTMIPPARPRLVPRPRLLERLEEGLGYDLVLVSAPAGFGKTTLVSEWAREERPGVHICWVSLDESDSDPVRFVEYVILALQGFRPGLGETVLAWLHSPQPPPARAVLVGLSNELVGLDEDVVLVLDDFQFVTSADVHDAVSSLLDHMPPHVHLLIATRADPPLPLARLRGRGQLLELGEDALRFKVEEAAELFRGPSGAPLAAEHVKALTERTEGWAVGLKMAALSLSQQQDVSAFIQSFAGSQRFVMDYLIEEVLEQQPPEVKDFLLKTSVLEKLTAPLCDAVAGRTDSDSLLPQLEHSNLLLVPLDDSRQWYRYEHLFSDLLCHQLTRAAGEEAVADLHRRASAWYRANGFPREAIDHSLAARDWEAAADLIDEVAGRYASAGEMVTVRAWLESLPEELLMTKGTLFGNYVFSLITTGRLDKAEALLDRGESRAAGDREELGRITACRSIIESNRGNIARSTELAHKALPLLPTSEAGLRCLLSMNLGGAYLYLGRFELAEPLLSEGYRDATKVGNSYAAMAALSALADISRQRGKLSHAAELLEQALELAPGSPPCTVVHLLLAGLLYERNELESAMAHCDIGLGLNRLLGHPAWQLGLLSYSVHIAMSSGDEARALEATDRLDQFVAGSAGRDARLAQAMHHVGLALRQGDMDEASRWGDRLMHLESEGPITFEQRLVLIRLFRRRGQRDEISQQIERLYRSAGVEPFSPEWKRWLIEIRTAQALLASEPDEALGFLAEALRAGEPEGYIRSFVDPGPRLAPLLRSAVSQGICPEYAAKLLTIIEAEKRRRTATGASLRPPPIYAVLTERELEILRLVGAGMSNRQIAGKLYISLGTVKVHLHNISEKLNASSRTGAVARARELKLL